MDPIEIEKGYTTAENVHKLRRLADALEQGKKFEIKIAGQRITVPPDAEVVFEYELSEEESELEIEIKWKPKSR